MPRKAWQQLALVLGDAALSLLSSGVLYISISRLSGPELLGTYALAFAWLTLFQGVSSFGIPVFLMREVGAYGRNAAPYVAHAMLLGLGSGFVALCLMLAAVRLLGYSTYVVQVISISSLALIPAFLNTVCRSAFLALREMHLMFLVTVVEVAIVMSASISLLLSGYGAVALMITLVVAKITSASIALTLLHRGASHVRWSFNLGLLTRTAKTVSVLGIGNMLGMLTMRINIIMVSAWVDIVSVGHFAAATKVMEMGLMVSNLFGNLLMSRIAYNFNTQGNRDPNYFAAWYEALFALLLPISVGVWIFAWPILETLFGAGFGNALWVVRILMVYLVIESADMIMSIILIAAHRQREDVSRLASNPVTNIALTLALLPTMGIMGAAIGRVGGVAASATLRHLLIARALTRVKWLRFVLKPALISIGVGSICYLLPDLGHPAWLLLLYIAVTTALLTVSCSFSRSVIKDMMSFP